MQPRRIADDDTVIRLGDRAGEVAILLALLVVVRFDDGENAAEFVFKRIDGLGRYDTVQAGYFVPEIEERFVRSR